MDKIKSGQPISRRTGLDRRWIPSANHQPERRRSRERRMIRNRSFLEPFDSNGADENSAVSSEINTQTIQTEVKNPALAFDKEGFYANRGAVVSKGAPNDGCAAIKTSHR